MLAAAQERLTGGLHLVVIEGRRSPEGQRMMYQATWEELRRPHPEKEERALRALVSGRWYSSSPGSDARRAEGRCRAELPAVELLTQFP